MCVCVCVFIDVCVCVCVCVCADAVVCLWRLSEGAVGGNLEGADAGNKENWTVTKILRCVCVCV